MARHLRAGLPARAGPGAGPARDRGRGGGAPPGRVGAHGGTRRAPSCAPAPLGRAGLAYARAWGGLAREVAHEGRVDAVVAGYPAQPDAVPAWCVARARGVPLVVDMMISLADTLARRPRPGRPGDRRGAGRDRPPVAAPRGPGPGGHRGGRRLAHRALRRPARADRGGSGRRGARPLSMRARARRPPARALLRQARPAPRRRDRARGGPRTLLAAAAADRRRAAGPVAGGRAGARPPPRASRGSDGCPTSELGAAVAGAAICLGVFGTSAKAARVVPTRSGRRWRPGGRP